MAFVPNPKMDLPMIVLHLIKFMDKKKKHIYFTKIVKTLEKYSEHDVMSAIVTLEDWSLIESRYDSIESGKVGRCYHLTESAIRLFKHWKKEEKYGKEKVMLN